MPVTEYLRFDLTLRIDADAEGALCATSPQARQWRQPVALASLDFGYFAGWRDSATVRRLTKPGPPGHGSAQEIVPRLALEIVEPSVHAHPLEQLLQPLQSDMQRYFGWHLPIVRLVPVPARVLSIGMTMPIRILEIETEPAWKISKSLREIVDRNLPLADRVYKIDQTTFAEVAAFRARSGWKTAEVLHFGRWPVKPVSVSDPKTPGTLGWLLRLCDTWQTRLVILHCLSEHEAQVARVVAARLAARGGPAIVVPVMQEMLSVAPIYKELYANLIHDLPQEVNWRAIHEKLGTNAGPFPGLWVGGGREDILRFSTLGTRLVRMSVNAAALSEGERLLGSSGELRMIKTSLRPPGRVKLSPEPAIWPSVLKLAKPANLPQTIYLTEPFADLAENWQTISFDREREGVFPLAAHLESIRGARLSPGITGTPAKHFMARNRARFLQAAFYESKNPTHRPTPRRRRTALLQRTTYLLGVHIGPRGGSISIFGEIALVEEDFKWTPEMEGTWVEVGVTGLDFEVLGDPVQEMWLPRYGPSERIYFAVRAPDTPSARLRVCLYYQGNVLQSIRFAAILNPLRTPSSAPEDARRLLAEALDVEQASLEDDWQHGHLEYTLSPNLVQFEQHPPKTLSIVANELGNVSVVTLKGKEDFSFRADENLGDRVKKVRDTLVKVAVEDPTIPRENWLYSFADPTTRGAASDAAFKALAGAGWKLFSAIAPADPEERKKLVKSLEEEGGVIQVSHILLQKVIPWAVVYDRMYDVDSVTDEHGMPIPHEVCHVPMGTGTGGKFPPCGDHPSCPLHEVQQKQRSGNKVLPKTVVCPRHFWGFRHVIEIPVQQAARSGESPPSPFETIAADKNVNLVAGFHGGLKFYSPHKVGLIDLLQRQKLTAAWRSWEGRREALLKSLKATDLDLIYFYCHASTTNEQTELDPLLLLCPDSKSPDERIAPDALDIDDTSESPWAHHPLVFLNGCGTAAFSPRALSPFITMLVQRRGAGGILGTEALVFEALAVEMAQLFLNAFLSHKSAGEALLLARRHLLSEGNPLGLNYTFYGLARFGLPPANLA